MEKSSSRNFQTNFFERVYKIVQKIPKGKVMTYGAIADILGTKDARRVGHALHANKSSEVPCHRVVNKDGRLAPGYAFGGPNEQKNRLISEGVIFTEAGQVDLKKCQL
jgi:methylated-DNA-protein-cysteine methyltransferase-like protein